MYIANKLRTTVGFCVIQLRVNYSALTYLGSTPEVRPMGQASRWLDFIQEFDFRANCRKMKILGHIKLPLKLDKKENHQ